MALFYETHNRLCSIYNSSFLCVTLSPQSDSIGFGESQFKHPLDSYFVGARCSSVVRAFTHSSMGRRIDHSWGAGGGGGRVGPIELCLVPASAP